MNVRDLVPPETDIKLFPQVRNGKSGKRETELLRKDGSRFIAEINGYPIQLAGQNLVLGITRDITERKQTEEKLKESEEKYRALFEKEENAIFIFEPDTFIIVDANPAMTKTYGYSYDELIGMNCLKLSAEREKSKAVAAEADKKGKVDVKLRWHKKKDGTVFPLELQVYQTELEGRTVGYAVAKDITERKQVEEALRESEAKFRSIVENASPVIFTIDKEGKFLLSEGKSLETLGLKPGQVVGMSAFEIYRDYPAILKGIKEALAGNTFRDVIEVGDVYFDIFYTPNKDDSGYFDSIIGMAIDITELKRAEEALRESEENLRTTLNSIGDAVIATDTEGDITRMNPGSRNAHRLERERSGWETTCRRIQYCQQPNPRTGREPG